LAVFRRRFDAPARRGQHRAGLSAPKRWLLFLAIMFAVSGGIVTLADKGARNVALAWATHFSQRTGLDTQTSQTSQPTAAAGLDQDSRAIIQVADSQPAELHGSDESAKPVARQFGLPMPAPDRHGVVHLDSAGPYRTCDITVVGELAIVGADGIQPQILIEDQPVKLCAASLRMKNVRIGVRPGLSGRTPKSKSLLRVQAQELIVDGCVFDGGSASVVAEAGEPEHNVSHPVFAAPTGPASIAWKLLDAAEQFGGKATIRNTLLLGDGPGLYLAQAVKNVDFNNVLKIGPGPLFQLAGMPTAKSNLTLRLSHTTCRASGAVVRWIVSPEGPPRGRIVVEAGDCVFDIVTPRAALFELAGVPFDSERAYSEWLKALRMTGEGSLTRPALEVAAWVSTIDGRVTPLANATVEVEGLFAGEFRFAGESDKLPADSEVHDAEAPRRSSEPPGIDAAALPEA
jgi:hypothetical protein